MARFNFRNFTTGFNEQKGNEKIKKINKDLLLLL